MTIIKILVQVELGEDTRPGAYVVDLPEALRWSIERQAGLVADESTDGARPRVTAIVEEQRRPCCVVCHQLHSPRAKNHASGLCGACLVEANARV